MPGWLISLLSIGGTLVVMWLIRQFRKPEKTIQHRIEHVYGVDDPQFLRSMSGLLPPPMCEGNRVTPLINGDRIFEAMLDAIRGASTSITFETFIYWSGEIGMQFARALAERADAGVKTHVLLDWFGSKAMDGEALNLLRASKAQVERYHKPKLLRFGRMNHRTHRKILVIDGRIGFTGGVGIADEWRGDAQDPDHWRDTHYRIDGPCVRELQTSFMDNWLKSHEAVLHGEDYFPELEHAGDALCQLFSSGPQEGSESVRLMYLLSITAAKRTVRLATAYFVPDDLAVRTLIEARKRGVTIQIIVPGEHIDYSIVRRSSRASWGDLLKAGVEIYEYQPTMFHHKSLVVDEQWVSIGSANFDYRSFRLNDESNLNVMNREVAASEIEQFEQDLSRSRPITHEEWLNRPWSEKLREHAAALLRTQL